VTELDIWCHVVLIHLSDEWDNCAHLRGSHACIVACDSSDCVLQIVETIVKIKLPEDVHGALHDGVVLCHLANHLRPHSVSSVHVPSPSVVTYSLVRHVGFTRQFFKICGPLTRRNMRSYRRPRLHIRNSRKTNVWISTYLTLSVAAILLTATSTNVQYNTLQHLSFALTSFLCHKSIFCIGVYSISQGIIIISSCLCLCLTCVMYFIPREVLSLQRTGVCVYL